MSQMWLKPVHKPNSFTSRASTTWSTRSAPLFATTNLPVSTRWKRGRYGLAYGPRAATVSSRTVPRTHFEVCFPGPQRARVPELRKPEGMWINSTLTNPIRNAGCRWQGHRTPLSLASIHRFLSHNRPSSHNRIATENYVTPVNENALSTARLWGDHGKRVPVPWTAHAWPILLHR